MTEEEAQAWLAAQGYWHGEPGDRLRAFAQMLIDESQRQNLISAASREQIWARHIVDSAQLVPLAQAHGDSTGLWVDLGTGAGLPGIVIGCLRPEPLLMIELRPLRTAFLQRCVEALGLTHARVMTAKVERAVLDAPAAVISARAYAPMDRLLNSAAHLTDSSTTWLLPKGRNAENELAIARRDWQAAFHVEQSVTGADSAILTITDLKRRETKPKTAVAPRNSRRSRRPMKERP